MFEPTSPDASGGRLVAAVALGVLLVGVVAAVSIVFGAASPTTRQTAPSPSAVAGAPSSGETAPLELVALGHERDDDRLIVRGVVRNPREGREIDRLAAMVTVFDHDGALVTTARAPIAHATLAGGEESPFLLTIPDAGDVGRYRISFRVDDRVVSHVDRREGVDAVQLKRERE